MPVSSKQHDANLPELSNINFLNDHTTVDNGCKTEMHKSTHAVVQK